MSTIPQRLGNYELHQRMARGGMGEVWKAFDTRLQRYVAIKLLHTNLQQDPDFVTRFEREAQLVASLHHPNIVKIHDFQVAQPPESERTLAYMVMDYVEGQTLAQYIRTTSRKGNFPSASDLLYIFSMISLAIDYAHQQNMIHRDIKPANILLDQRTVTTRTMGEPILTDFGIARLQGVASGTVVGSLLGTPLYIAPEQAEGRHGDYRSDLYSLGIILYEMLTGVTPFRGETTIAILMQHINDIPTPPALINPHIPPAVSNVILKSISKKPEDRFSSASEMTIALAEAFEEPIPRILLKKPASSNTANTYQGTNYSSAGYTDPTLAQSPVFLSPTLSNTPQGLVDLGQISQTPVPANAYAFDPQIPFRQPPSGENLPPSSLVASPPQGGGNWIPDHSQKKSTRALAFLLTTIVVVMFAFGISVFALFSGQTPGASQKTVGYVTFTHSPQATAGNYDQLQVEVDDVTVPNNGRVYYAWIESPQAEADQPHWRLEISSGSIRSSDLLYPRHKNLLMANTILLITEESEVPEKPLVPYPTLDARRYYAQISTTSETRFEIKACPSDPNNNICLR